MSPASDIVPVILCGGSGTRLWPASRRSYPKQFCPLLPGETLFERTAHRVAAPGYTAPLVLTNSEFRFIVADGLGEKGLGQGSGEGRGDAPRIVIEPEMRNTAPAVCLAALMVAADDPEALMLVLPSDHMIRDDAAFHRAVAAGAEAARAGQAVTFGVVPTRAETGYGWLELAGPPQGGPEPFLRFVEKPDRARAEEMLAAGRYLWNAGIFLFRARDILAAFEAHAPEILAACRRALDEGRHDLGFFRPDEAAYGGSPSISLDYAVMERLGGGTAVPLDCGWNDLGSWETVWREAERDEAGNAATGAAMAIDCHDSFLMAEGEGPRLVGLGLERMVAVAMRDAVLVAPMERAQEVRSAVDALKAAGAEEAELYPRDHRPWGWFEVLARGPRFQVKRIMVRPGGRLSLQSHRHRAEHWIVVAGTARVTIGDEVKDLSADQSCYVPLGERHRLENPGSGELHLIEIQSGSYLGEDDIVRYEDVYARG